MGEVHRRMGDNNDAMECHSNALDVYVHVFGHSQSLVADTHNKCALFDLILTAQSTHI